MYNESLARGNLARLLLRATALVFYTKGPWFNPNQRYFLTSILVTQKRNTQTSQQMAAPRNSSTACKASQKIPKERKPTSKYDVFFNGDGVFSNAISQKYNFNQQYIIKSLARSNRTSLLLRATALAFCTKSPWVNPNQRHCLTSTFVTWT